ncbi:MAG: GNAT family N-acetyltransferase [Bacteroidales bacterium]|nr:GNAT family N-acetyltransferase [Bacteroidales bacterium]
MKIIKRTATENDKEFLYSLNKIVYQDLVKKTIGQWNDSFQRDYFDQKWEKSGYKVIEKNHKMIGTIWVEYEPSQNTLKEIQLLPEFQKQGIGTNLLLAEIELAKKVKIPLLLRLLKGNQSQSLYERLGFQTYDEQEKYLYMKFDV